MGSSSPIFGGENYFENGSGSMSIEAQAAAQVSVRAAQRQPKDPAPVAGSFLVG